MIRRRVAWGGNPGRAQGIGKAGKKGAVSDFNSSMENQRAKMGEWALPVSDGKSNHLSSGDFH
jgi:hypothetical protein